jgi:alpha-L-fucosidase
MVKRIIFIPLLLVGFASFSQRSNRSTSSLDKKIVERKTIKLPGDTANGIPDGPYTATWESVKTNYQMPEWFKDAKFGIFIHWGLYSVPAHFSEWYPRHMYHTPAAIKWHQEHYGAQDKFGYKDFIPLFKAEKFNPDQWAELFRKAGAKFVIPTAEHHDGFAMYDSKLTRWDAMDMGPKRDLMGELAKAVRKQGLRFGVSNHRIENWDFMYPADSLKTDLFDPKYADFYGPPQKPFMRTVGQREVLQDQAAAPQSKAFLEEWLARCQELVDKLQPDLFYFDNGINPRTLDPVKLRFAAYYYNRAAAWKKPVSVVSKSDAYLFGSIKDYERQGTAPFQLQSSYWVTDDPIGDKFGYVDSMGVLNAEAIVPRIIQNVSRNGSYILNISPKSDGTIPENQQAVLLDIGKWMETNGEAIYGTRSWKRDNDGTVYFTKKGNTLYAIALKWPEAPLVIPSVPLNIGKVTSVQLLGSNAKLTYKQNDQGLFVTFPSTPTGKYAYALKIEGLTIRD